MIQARETQRSTVWNKALPPVWCWEADPRAVQGHVTFPGHHQGCGEYQSMKRNQMIDVPKRVERLWFDIKPNAPSAAA